MNYLKIKNQSQNMFRGSILFGKTRVYLLCTPLYQGFGLYQRRYLDR